MRDFFCAVWIIHDLRGYAYVFCLIDGSSKYVYPYLHLLPHELKYDRLLFPFSSSASQLYTSQPSDDAISS